jgi:4-amino-4-deoxy-L-arabinose transferase-like glycosyltransferase
MSISGVLGRSQNALSRLLDALIEPARRERAVLVVLAAYAVVWTLYGTIAKSSQDIHFDMGEMVAWSREVSLGTTKHPPLGAWLVGAWFSVFPLADWAYYLFAILLATFALWVAWTISARYLDGEKRVVGLALLTLVPFFNFHALKYNANTVMVPLWAVTTWLFLRSFETRGVVFAAGAGLAAAAAMLGKYWSIFLLLGLAVAALVDRRRSAYFRSPAPYITILVGGAALAPHLAWLYGSHFATFGYALSSHPGTWLSAIRSCFEYVIGALAYLVAPTLLVIVLARPTRAALIDMLWPRDEERRFVLLAFALPLLLPAIAALATREEIISLWAMGSMTLFPVVLLSSPRVVISRVTAVRILATAIAVPLPVLAASPGIAMIIHRNGVSNFATHYHLVANAIEKVWRETTDRPLRLVGSYDNVVNGVAFYLSDRPSTVEIVTPARTPWADEARVARDGVALVCPTVESLCMRAIETRAASHPSAKRVEVEISRSYFGVPGPPERYLIVTIPPAER